MEIVRVALLGHKDHGKSTLIGNSLILSKSIPESRVDEAKRASNDLGIEFEPAYLLDTFSDERKDGMTVDNTRAQVLFKNYAFELIDVPGHEELIRSMISGASSSDFALVVVSALKEEGITDQTRRHIYASNLLGINRYIVAVNKMDAVNYDEKTFLKIKESISQFLTSIGVPTDSFFVLPISARTGDNVSSASSNLQWYRGPVLFDQLISFANSTTEKKDDVLRVAVQSIMNFRGSKAVLGQVISGNISLSDELKLYPQNLNLNISSMMKGNSPAKEATSGDSIALITDTPIQGSVRGGIISSKDSNVRISDEFTLNAFLLEEPQGELELRLNNVGTKIVSYSIKRVMDPTRGTQITRNSVQPLEAATMEVKLERKIVCDNFISCPTLGRVVLFSGSKLLGAGVISSL